MIGDRYWTTGITVRWDGERNEKVSASLEFFDDGFCEDGSTEGTLTTRYWRTGLAESIDLLIADAARLGIEFRRTTLDCPHLYVVGDGEDEEEDLPENWRELLAEQAARLGWPTEGYSRSGLVDH